MFLRRAKHALGRFWHQDAGTASMETVIMFPFLFMALVFSYEYYDMFRYKSVREKAAYTVADMLSRETAVVNDDYMDNVKTLFDMITRDAGDNQVRVTVIRYHLDPSQNIDEFDLRWSEVRGTGPLAALTEADVANAHDAFPELANGQDLILVDTASQYNPRITTNLVSDSDVRIRMFVPLRFAAQLCYTGVCTSS